MTDTTPVTEDDAREMHEWCDAHAPSDKNQTPMAKVIRHLRATVPRPPKPLADELREHAKWEHDIGATGHSADLSALADRVKAEAKRKDSHADNQRKELARLNTKVASLTELYSQAEATLVDVASERDEARAEADRLKGQLRWLRRRVHEDVTVCIDDAMTTLPDPADVPQDEPWIVSYSNVTHIGVRTEENRTFPWRIIDGDDTDQVHDRVITLVARLVPDVRRVIDRPEDLDKLPLTSVVLDTEGCPWTRQGDGKWRFGNNTQTSSDLLRYMTTSVTVIHEPMVDSGSDS